MTLITLANFWFRQRQRRKAARARTCLVLCGNTNIFTSKMSVKNIIADFLLKTWHCTIVTRPHVILLSNFKIIVLQLDLILHFLLNFLRAIVFLQRCGYFAWIFVPGQDNENPEKPTKANGTHTIEQQPSHSHSSDFKHSDSSLSITLQQFLFFPAIFQRVLLICFRSNTLLFDAPPLHPGSENWLWWSQNFAKLNFAKA